MSVSILLGVPGKLKDLGTKIQTLIDRPAPGPYVLAKDINYPNVGWVSTTFIIPDTADNLVIDITGKTIINEINLYSREDCVVHGNVSGQQSDAARATITSRIVIDNNTAITGPTSTNFYRAISKDWTGTRTNSTTAVNCKFLSPILASSSVKIYAQADTITVSGRIGSPTKFKTLRVDYNLISLK